MIYAPTAPSTTTVRRTNLIAPHETSLASMVEEGALRDWRMTLNSVHEFSAPPSVDQTESSHW